MRFALTLALFLWMHGAAAQTPPLPELSGADKPPAKADEKGKARPRVSLKPKGGTGSSVGDDASGGGAATAPSSKGGTPGSPSGSFTGSAPRP